MKQRDVSRVLLNQAFYQPAESEYQALARGVLLRAWMDALGDHWPHYAEAYYWMLSDSEAECSFLWWLQFLGRNRRAMAERLRRELRRVVPVCPPNDFAARRNSNSRLPDGSAPPKRERVPRKLIRRSS